MILHPAKTKRMLLTTRQKHQLRPLHLNLVLKTVILNKFMSTGTLALLLMMNLAGDHTLLAIVKHFFFFFLNLYLLLQLRHFVDTPKRKRFYHAHISSHLTYASTVWDGCSDILFNKLNSLHKRAAKLMISDSSLSTDTKLRYLGIFPLKEKLMFNKAVLVFKA